jgi:hypothetical protein
MTTKEERAPAIENKVYDQWIASTPVSPENEATVRAQVKAAVEATYVETFTDDDWLASAIGRLQVERGGTVA